MKLENQLCSLERAKRLKELGIIQESLFFWYRAPHDNGKDEYWETDEIVYKPWFVNTSFPEDECEGCTFYAHGTEQYSAYTVAELGRMLPTSLALNEGHNWSFYHRHNWKGESVGYSAYGVNSIEQGWYTKESESRADMLIHLLESGLITADECNKKLTEL
jgi:hypothetical protein